MRPAVFLLPRAFAVRAAWPAAWPALSFFQLFFGSADTARSGGVLFGVFHPTDELIARQRRDIPPTFENRRRGEQDLSQVGGELVYDPAGHPLAAHEKTVAVAGASECSSHERGLRPQLANSPCTTVRPVGLFRRRGTRAHTPNDILEEDAEMHETAGPSLLGPGALDFDASPLGVQPRRDRQSDVEELRASADPEDDGAEEELIASERRDEEGHP